MHERYANGDLPGAPFTNMKPTEEETRKLATFLETGQMLAGTYGLKAAISRVLETLGRHHGAVRGVVMLFDSDTSELRIIASHGLEESAVRRIKYRIGEGITGRVVETGKPVVVPQVSREPMFLDRLGVRKPALSRQELTFICVPILVNRKPVGALGVDLRYKAHRDYERATSFFSIIANSNPLRQVYEQVTQVARTNTTVLLRGESGTGKELIAHAIHYNSLRADKPFIKVSCAALPETLIESELFGYEKGAFTGAQNRKKGRFELAEGGTLFLDEIGDLNISTQIKLLRVLQEREFERLGGTETLKINVRLVAATNKDLTRAINEGQFREDLYYRLNVFAIFMPPLRERKSDVLLLADHFLEKFAHEHGKRIKRISTSAIDMLASYHWPGNVRELENIIERAVLVCETGVIHGHHLPPTLQTAERSGTLTRLSLDDAVGAYESDLIQDALKTTRGNRKRAAQLLDTTERILGYKVKKYGIDCERFRS